GHIGDPAGDGVGGLDARALGQEDGDDAVALPHVVPDAHAGQRGPDVALQAPLEHVPVAALEYDLAELEQHARLPEAGAGTRDDTRRRLDGHDVPPNRYRGKALRQTSTR